jgi:hypothetical protein
MNAKWILHFILIGILALLGVTAACSGSSATPVSSPPATVGVQPVEIVSVSGPLQPINPGGPVVEIVLRNVSPQPATTLTASLELNRSYTFSFSVSSSALLAPNQDTSAKQTLIGGGFSDTLNYSLAVSGTLQDGQTFSFSQPIKIVAPPTQ